MYIFNIIFCNWAFRGDIFVNREGRGTIRGCVLVNREGGRRNRGCLPTIRGGMKTNRGGINGIEAILEVLILGFFGKVAF